MLDFRKAQESDVVISISSFGVHINFARIPDADVCQDICNITTPGFQIQKINSLEYFVLVPMAYNNTKVGKIIASHLRENHKLNCDVLILMLPEMPIPKFKK